jgi:hypothetical protein
MRKLVERDACNGVGSRFPCKSNGIGVRLIGVLGNGNTRLARALEVSDTLTETNQDTKDICKLVNRVSNGVS